MPEPGSTPAPGGPRRRYAELSFSTIAFGIILGGIMNAAITYAGLKIGFTIVGSAIAAVLGFGVLRGILRRGTILETNITQTIASAVNTSNSGIIFTVPVLLLLGYKLSFAQLDFWLITLACMAGGILGVAFIVPLRKQMLDIDRLRFPSATAVGAILKSPGAGIMKSVVLAAGVLVAILIYLPVGLPAIKSPATIEQLDSLVGRERISAADAERTKTISGWIAAQRAPESEVERGRLVAEYRELRAADSPDEARATRIAGLRSRLDALKKDSPHSEALSIAVFDATSGKRTWDSLREPDTGWAQSPLPGFKDLGIRLGQRTDPDTGRLTAASDRDGDGRPDLVVTDEVVDVGRILGLPEEMQFAFAIAPFALGAGYLTGRAGLMVLAGGVLAYLVLNPLGFRLGWIPDTVRPHQVPGYALGAFNRPLGIGLLLGGALVGVLAALPAIREAIKSIALAGKGVKGGTDELGLKPLILIVAAGMFVLFLAAEFIGEPTASTGGWLSGLNPWLAKGIIVLVAGVWIWFAGIIIAQCTGMTDWSPISGMALLTVVLVMMLAGPTDVVSAILIGAALCVAIAGASDMMSDLKTGHIVGASPRSQQIVEIATILIGPIITMSTLVLIASVNLKQFGSPIGPDTPTVAPQAQALKAVVEGVQGGQVPYALYGFGAIVGALLGLGAFPGLGVLVGLSMYLPIIYILTYGVGCILNVIVGRIKGRVWAEEWGVPFCAGLIVGEACLALVINSIVLIRG